MIPCPLTLRAHPRTWSAAAFHRLSSCPPTALIPILKLIPTPHAFLCFHTITTIKFHNSFLLIFIQNARGVPLPSFNQSGIYGAELPTWLGRSGTNLSSSPLDATLMDIPARGCKQMTYAMAKRFRCNTYKKPGGGGPADDLRRRSDVWTFRRSDRSSTVCGAAEIPTRSGR